MSKYTPGPWRISGFESAGTKNRVVMGADDFSICHIGERNRAENIANAHLISTAPELLKALKAWEHWYSNDSTELNREIARAAGVRAIAKVEGLDPENAPESAAQPQRDAKT
jgi:hypothetical protein